MKSVRAAPNATWLVPGCCLDRYDLLLQVAEGGMGLLWLARQQGKHGFDRIVAIKTILPRLASDGGFRRMFLDEARVVSRIEHPNVAQVLDLGEERGVLFLVMEWIDGESLNKVGRAFAGETGELMPVGVLARIMVDVCAGLHAAHEITGDDGLPLGVVHRDVSPHNVLVGFRGTTKVIDFGIAKARNRIAHDTSVGLVKGKVAYMAPEQARGAEVDRRTDVWSAGATLYRLLAGCVPFDAPEPVAMLHRLMEGPPPAPLPSSVPEPIRLVVERALALEAGKRFATAQEMGAALEKAMLVANVHTTHEGVAAFMANHLGEGRAARSQEIEHAVRESRARMRVEPASTQVGARPEIPMPPSPGGGLGLARDAAGLARPSGRPTAIEGPQPSAGARAMRPPPPEARIESAPTTGGMRDGLAAPPASVPVLLRVRPQASRPFVRWIAGAGLLGAGLAGGFVWRALQSPRPIGAAVASPPTLPGPGETPLLPALPPPVLSSVPATIRRPDLPAPEAPTPDLATPDAPALVPTFAHPKDPRVSATPPAADRGPADDLLERARRARRAGRIDDAAALFAAAVESAPTDSEALTGLAEVREAQGLTAGAIALYRRALAVNPRYLPARLGLADSLWTSGPRDEARTAYAAIVARFPTALTPDRARERAAGGAVDDKTTR